MGFIRAAQDAGAPAGRPLRPLVSRRPGPSSQCLLSGGGSYSPASWDRQGPKSTHSANASHRGERGKARPSTTRREGEGTFRPLGLAPSLVFPSAQLTWSRLCLSCLCLLAVAAARAGNEWNVPWPGGSSRARQGGWGRGEEMRGGGARAAWEARPPRSSPHPPRYSG